MAYNKEVAETHEFLLSIIESTPYGILTVNPDGDITIANSQALSHLGLKWNLNEIIGRNIKEVIDEPRELKMIINNRLDKGIRDFDLKEVSLEEKFLTCRGRKISSGMIITIADITSIKESEYNSLKSMLEGQELERKRLAREIHDGIGPILSTLKMNLANIEGDIENLNHELSEKFRKSYLMIDEASDDLRSISHNLMPRVLSDFGLIDALETLCDKINTTKNLEISFINSGLRGRLDEVTELGLYRISQELISNSLKHSQAKKITLQLIKRESTLRLTYEDNGIGFDLAKNNDGIGLINIENRAKALSGQVIIDTQQNRGMTATVEIPLS